MRIFGRDEEWGGRFQLFGFPLIGGWLPYVGYRERVVSPEELKEFGIDSKVSITYNPLELEWFGKGLSYGRIKVPLDGEEEED